MSASNTEASGQSQVGKPISILVVQLGGMDEVFRSLMALKAIKHLYPQAKIDFISRKEATPALKRVEWLNSHIETPSSSTEERFQTVATWIDQIINQNYDYLVNWTYAKKHRRMSAIASTLIPAMVKFGETLRDDLTYLSSDAWSLYRETWMRAGNSITGEGAVEQDIHYTDVITTQLLTGLQIHAGDPTPEAGHGSVSSRYFFKGASLVADPNSLAHVWINRPKNLKWVALNSDTLNERGSELVEIILRRHPDAGIAIVGQQPWRNDDISNPRVLNLTVESSEFPVELGIQVLSNCTSIISGPSSWIDLASLMNLRVVYVVSELHAPNSLKWTETGPYGNGHMAIASTQEWKPEAVYAVWSYLQSEWFHKGTFNLKTHFSNLELSSAWDESLSEGGIYRSRIRPAEEGGGVCFENQNGQPLNFEGWMVRMRGQLARAWFCGWLPSIDVETARMQLSPPLIKRVRGIQESLQVLDKLSREGRIIAAELRVAADAIRNHYLMSIEDREVIENFGQKLAEIENLMIRTTQVEPELKCMVLWYQGMMNHLRGESVSEMAKETAHAFDLVNEGIELISLYCEKTIASAKPRSITVTPSLSVVSPPAH